ncbi:MAG: hypothetical protein DI617_02995 [Streptococcus pyogenes]|nr:MAG: hypothetical protein DI617_02995 [Streptococcus pyogenes]
MKKLLMVVAMCLAFCAVAVNAETGRKWGLAPDQQKVYDGNNRPIPVSVSNNTITVTLPQGWSMWFDGDKNKQPHTPIKEVKLFNKPVDKPQQVIYNNNHGEAGLPVTVTVEPPSDNKDKLTVSFQGDGFYAGSVYLWDSETITEEKLNQDMEKLYLQYVAYDNSKTWYQRLGDSIRDQWWNFTGMF